MSLPASPGRVEIGAMPEVSFESINEAISEIDQLGSFEACWPVIEELGNQQPHLLGLLLQVGNEALEESQFQHLMILCLVIWKSYSKAYTGFKELSIEDLMADFKIHSAEFVALSSDNNEDVENYLKLQSTQMDPNIMEFLLEEIFPTQTESAPESLEELSVIFMLLTFFSKQISQASAPSLILTP